MVFQKVRRLLGGCFGGSTTLKSRKVERLLNAPYTTLLGQGAHAAAYKTLYKGQEAVLKIMKPLDRIDKFEYELDLLRLLDGAGGAPRVLAATKMVERDNKPVAAIMTFCGYDTLEKIIDRNEVDDLTYLKICLDLARKLKELQDKEISHNDLKPDNVIVNMVDGQPQVSIIDYGLSTKMGARLGMCGNWEFYIWVAPEVIINTTIKPNSDVFSLSDTLFHIHTEMDKPPVDLLQLEFDTGRFEPEDRPDIATVISRLEKMVESASVM